MVQPRRPKAVRLVVESGGVWGQELGGLSCIVVAGTGLKNEVMVESQVVGWVAVDG